MQPDVIAPQRSCPDECVSTNPRARGGCYTARAAPPQHAGNAPIPGSQKQARKRCPPTTAARGATTSPTSSTSSPGAGATTTSTTAARRESERERELQDELRRTRRALLEMRQERAAVDVAERPRFVAMSPKRRDARSKALRTGETTMTMRNLSSSSGAGATTTSLWSGGPRRPGRRLAGAAAVGRRRRARRFKVGAAAAAGLVPRRLLAGVEKVPGLAAPALLAGGLARPPREDRSDAAQWDVVRAGGAVGASITSARGTAAREKYPSKARTKLWRD